MDDYTTDHESSKGGISIVAQSAHFCELSTRIRDSHIKQSATDTHGEPLGGDHVGKLFSLIR